MIKPHHRHSPHRLALQAVQTGSLAGLRRACLPCQLDLDVRAPARAGQHGCPRVRGELKPECDTHLIRSTAHVAQLT